MKKRVNRHTPKQPQDPSYRLIALTRNQNALVDTADYDWLNQWNWYASWHPKEKTFYAERKPHSGLVRMHRKILGCGPKEEGDHINHNTLDNRRNNLRKSTRLQNGSNQKISVANSSGYKGVSWNKLRNKWRVQLKFRQKEVWIGYFTDAKEGAKAYDAAAKQYFGEFAHLNFS